MRAMIVAMLLALAASAIAAGPANGAQAGTPSPADAAVRRRIDAVVQRVRATYGGKTPVPGVVIGVWDANGASYQRAFGYADIANKRPMSIADHFRIGSNTKTFVVAVILQLVDEGKLRLDDTVSHFHLGLNVPDGNKITIRQLCDMRSGLVEAYDDPKLQQGTLKPGATFPPRQTIAWALRQKPYFAPGAGYHYSNTNYLLLGMIVEKITHDTVGNQVRTRLLEPYGLSNTSYPATEACRSRGRTVTYSRKTAPGKMSAVRFRWSSWVLPER